MSGPYDQQVLAQSIGRAGGLPGGPIGGLPGGLPGGLAAGHLGGQAGGLAAGQLGGHVGGVPGGLAVGALGGQSAALAVGPPGGLAPGQTVTQSSYAQRSEAFHVQPPVPPVVRGDRQRRQRTGSSSSSTVSERTYRVGGSAAPVGAVPVGIPGNTGTYQQYSAESHYSQGGAGTGGYAAAGNSFGSAVSVQRRQARHEKQVIRLPDQQGQVRQVRKRLPTPEPDVLERVYIQRTGNEVVEEITEIPTTPPPRVQERTVVEPAGPPQIIKRTVRVPPRSGGYAGYQQQGASFHSNVGQSSGNLLSAGSYGNVQQATGSYQQYGTGYGSVGGGYQQGYGSGGGYQQGYGSYGSGYSQGYGAVGGGYQQGYGSYGGGYQPGYGSYGGGYSQGYGPVGGGYQQGYGSVGGGYSQGAGRYPTQVSGPFPGIPANATCFLV